MNFNLRIEQLKNDGSEVAQQIKSLQNKIDELNNNREEAVIKSDHDKFLKLTKEYKALDSELQDRQALDLAITRSIKKMETEEKIQLKKKIYDDAKKWAEQVKQEKRYRPQYNISWDLHSFLIISYLLLFLNGLILGDTRMIEC